MTHIETLYEIGYHVTDRIPEDQALKVVDEIRKVVQENGGTPVSEGAIERMTLAYPIIRMENSKNVHYTDSYFGWMRFRLGDAANVAVLAKHLKTTKDVIRHLLVELPESALEKPVERRKPEAEESAEKTETAEAEVAPMSEKDIDKEIDSLVDAV